MLAIRFISFFEYTYFCFKSFFEYLPHSLPWPYFHIYIIWSQQVFGVVARDFSYSLVAVLKIVVNKFLASLPRTK